MKKFWSALGLSLTLSVSLFALAPLVMAMPDQTVVAIQGAEAAYAQVRGSGNVARELDAINAIMHAKDMAAPIFAEEWVARGLLEAQLGQPEKAIESLAEAETAEPMTRSPNPMAGVHLGRGWVSMLQGRFEDAEDEAKQALALNAGLSEARSLLQKAEAARQASRRLSPCDRTVPELAQLPAGQLQACVTAAKPGDLGLNALLFRLGSFHDNTHVSTLVPFLKAPTHKRAALTALGEVMRVQQLALLDPYLNEDDVLPVLLQIIARGRMELSAAQRQHIGSQVARRIVSPKTDPDSRLLMLDLLGALRYSQAGPLLKQMKRYADEIADGQYSGPPISKGNYLMQDIDDQELSYYGSLVIERLAAVENELSKTDLMLWAAAGRLDQVKQGLQKGANPNQRSSGGESAISLAVGQGRLEVVRLLLEKRVSPDTKGFAGVPILFTAAKNGATEIVKLLLAKGAKADVRESENGDTALMVAAARGDAELVRLLAKSPQILDAQAEYGRTALFKAMEAGHPEIVKLLLSLGADPEAAGGLVTQAVAKGDLEMVKLLLTQGVDLNAGDGPLPLLAAMESGNQAMFEFLLAQGADPNMADGNGVIPLVTAAEKGNLDQLRLLLAKGAKVDAAPTTRTALMQAAANNHLEAVKLLIEAGADLDARDKEGETALTLTVFINRDGQVARYLLEKGANPGFRTTSNQTALMTAASQGNVEMVRLLAKRAGTAEKSEALSRAVRAEYFEIIKLLREQGAEVNLKEQNPLQVAVDTGNLEIATWLLGQGADPNYRNSEGISVLATGLGWSMKPELVRLLLEKGASPKTADNEGVTPLMLAVERGNLEVVQLLVQKGADPKARSKAGKTALDLAKDASNAELVKYLQSLK